MFSKKLLLPCLGVAILVTSSSYTLAPKKPATYAQLFHKSIDEGFSKGISELAKDLTTYTFYKTWNFGKTVATYAAAKAALLYNTGFSFLTKKKLTKNNKIVASSLLEAIASLQKGQSLIITRQYDDTISVAVDDKKTH